MYPDSLPIDKAKKKKIGQYAKLNLFTFHVIFHFTHFSTQECSQHVKTMYAHKLNQYKQSIIFLNTFDSSY